MDFSETIAASDLTVGKCKQLVDLMKRCEFLRSRSFLGLGPRSFTYEKVKLAFLRNHWAIFYQISYVSFQVQGNKIIFI